MLKQATQVQDLHHNDFSSKVTAPPPTHQIGYNCPSGGSEEAVVATILDVGGHLLLFSCPEDPRAAASVNQVGQGVVSSPTVGSDWIVQIQTISGV